ncbi:hypothetical protein PHLGIDRAFT_122053 [Phlebiopsis gigantea 11061_1 CR5-6]|uniref:Uncharacterized protein n=1 Tax=Phlebiopsis gigantea (strain 11061_1 CR5-6) TaxID=745531 RepID=A0A0C3NE59_PHLG1|nr:hypothetical protein PHLGIDRAFT_122053 [Phlebiopsis gigantea 11061_1 CR5-6]
MSGPNAMEVEQSQPVQPSEPGITEDAAASLRAAALKTMKAKRRKGPDGSDVPSTLPPRPTVNTPSIVLDYGSEDQPETSTIIPAVNPTPTSAASTKPSPPPAPVPMEVDEDQTREEGEISDSESMPPPKSPSISRQTPRSASRPTAGRSSTMERPISSPPVPPSISHSNTNVKVEPLPQRIPEPSPAYEMYIVDDDHARPGLSLTEEQYNRGKDALLDLLGWGVPPDYIIDCGVSREMIYYAFTEMNLRLPPNFDTTGLPPALPYTSASPEPITPSAHFSRSRRASSAKGPAGDLHPSLPQKPTAPRGSPPTDSTTLSAAAASFVPSATLSAIPMQSADSPPSLIDMEQQRRQELLARKAVLASRKKQVASESMPPSTGARPESKPTVAIPAAVDDFLNSIGSATSDLAVEKAVAENYDDRMDVDDQDVDDQIPGLSLAVPTSKLSETRSPSAESTSPNAPLSAAPAESEDSVRSASADQSPPPAEGSESSGDNNTPRPSSAGPRRGAKRPVAADFVDEPATPRPYTHHHQHIHSHHPYARKRTTYFAGLNPHVRRMVIDLSDTEEEGHDNEKDDDDEEDIATQTKRMSSQQPSRPPTRLGLSSSLPVTGSLPSPNGLPKAAALHEKEQQIKKMRELIARRERAIMDKLAANSGRSTPMTAANDGIASEPPIVVKQEEDSDEVFVESTMAASIQSEPNPRLVSPNGLATPIGPLLVKQNIPPPIMQASNLNIVFYLRLFSLHPAFPAVRVSCSTPFDYHPPGSIHHITFVASYPVITAEAHHEDMPNASTPVCAA